MVLKKISYTNCKTVNSTLRTSQIECKSMSYKQKGERCNEESTLPICCRQVDVCYGVH